MNERIRELAEQAYNEQNPELLTNASRTFEHGVWLSGYSKKFAELIVQECFDVVINDGRFHDAKGIIRAGKSVAMEHFGVKE